MYTAVFAALKEELASWGISIMDHYKVISDWEYS